LAREAEIDHLQLAYRSAAAKFQEAATLVAGVALILISALTGALWTADFCRCALYLQNLFVQHNVDDYYSAWSLSVEEWYYLVFPLLLLAASIGRKRHDRYYGLAVVSFIVLITILRTIFGDDSDWGGERSPRRAFSRGLD
jgi:peptidoglycan/LPS O-acetylase OafA/YrhL